MKKTLNINLQLFAGEKTEKATPKKRRDAREKGQVFKSVEMNSAIVLLAVFGGLKFLLPSLYKALSDIYIDFLSKDLKEIVFSIDDIHTLFIGTVVSFFLILAPLMAIALIAGVTVNIAQVGFLFTSKPLQPKLDKLNPIAGFKRIFSKKALFEFAKSLLKLSIIAFVVYAECKDSLQVLPNLFKQELLQNINYIFSKAFTIGFKASIALLIFAVLDYVYQWWDYEKNLKMTKQEVKDEYKQTEGDPQIRSKIKEKQRQIGMSRMMQDIPQADVVITNPIHFAVALKYDAENDQAPIVLAKGQDFLALKIKEVAKKNDVVIVENKPLARGLYSTTEIGQQVPQELFHSVAEVLAFVYSLKNN